MRIAVLCATRRGYLFLKKLFELLPESEFVVFSFREEPWEPPFLNDIRKLTLSNRSQFIEARHVGTKEWQAFWDSTPIDLMFVLSWRYIIPERVYSRPGLGTFLFHDSLLPKYRGFSPTVWAIINGENHTGVTLCELVGEVDAGSILDQQSVPIGPDDVISEVMERVTEAYLQLLERNLTKIIGGNSRRHAQDHSEATFTCKRLPADNQIKWDAPTETIYNLIRAVTMPYPGAYTYLEGKKLIIWSARRLEKVPVYVGRIPGRVVEVKKGLGSVVLTGDGALLVTQLQLEGADPVCASEILNSLNYSLI